VLFAAQHGMPRRWNAAEIRLVKQFANDISLRRARRHARAAVACSLRPEPRELRS
jgi:GAF domain-containing protein